VFDAMAGFSFLKVTVDSDSGCGCFLFYVLGVL